MLSFFIGVITLIGLIILSTWCWHVHRYYKYLKRFPGPFPLPLLGNALEIPTTKDVIPALMRNQKKYGGIIKMTIGFTPRLVVTDYKFLEYLLANTSNLEKSYEYRFFYPWLGTGLLTSIGYKWKSHRKLLTPAFHFKILEEFAVIFESAGNVLIEKLRKNIGKDFDIFPAIALCTLDVICESAMGISVNAQKHPDSEYVRSVKEMCKIIIFRSFSSWQQNDMLYKLSNEYKTQKKLLKIIHSHTDSVIAQRRKLISTESGDLIDETTGVKKRLAFLDLLLQSKIDGKHLPNEHIREEVDTFMFEGHDTTASAISFTIFSLANYPDIQEKVMDELRGILGEDKNRVATYRELQEMKYLEMVIKETMRVYTTVPFIGRIIEEDVEYDGGILPKGLMITIFLHGLHHNPEVFPDPEKFDPERFNFDNHTERNPFLYLPFSAGPRNCIGQRFALMEVKACVSKLLMNFEILPVVPQHKPILLAESILKSENGLLIRLKER